MENLKPVDVAIVGGGWTGLMMAKEIATRTGLNVTVLERGGPRQTADYAQDMADSDHAGVVLGCREGGGEIDPQNPRPRTRAQQTKAGHIQTHGPRGAQGDVGFGGTQLRRRRRSTSVQVGTELALASLPAHGSDHLAAHDETADVGAVGFADELLYEKIRV